MSLPYATTTIEVLRPSPTEDPYERSAPETSVVTGVRANFSSPSGEDQIIGGEQSRVDMRLECDVCDLHHSDIVRDEGSTERWSVVWVRERIGLGLDHVAAGVRRVEGSAA